MVVGQDRRSQSRGKREVATPRAQVAGGGGCRVVDVLRVGPPVPVTVDPEHRPSAGNELHRADGAVPARVSVQPPAVGVTDRGGARAIKHRPQHRRHRAVRGVHRASGQRSRFHLPDRGEQADGEMARRGRAGDSLAVGGEQNLGDRPRARRRQHLATAGSACRCRGSCGGRRVWHRHFGDGCRRLVDGPRRGCRQRRCTCPAYTLRWGAGQNGTHQQNEHRCDRRRRPEQPVGSHDARRSEPYFRFRERAPTLWSTFSPARSPADDGSSPI